MLIESITASLTVFWKDLNKLPAHFKWAGRDAKERAQEAAKKWLIDEQVENVVCKSQCVLSNN